MCGRLDRTLNNVFVPGELAMARVAVYSTILASSILFAGQAMAQDAAVGERLFRTRCGSCHTVQPGQNRIGPSLAGVVGRKAGSVDGARYSQGMRDLGVTWDAAQLSTFLANPRAVVTGTTMTVSVPNEADRSNIVAYLQSLATPAN
jgi:cytochrome c